MKFYLSSFKLGDKPEELIRLLGKSQRSELVTVLNKKRKIAYIPNACDFTNADPERRKRGETQDMDSLKNIGLDVEYLDLKEYFHKTDELRKKISEFDWVFVKWWNTFILRQAMKLSWFDTIFEELKNRDNFVYAWYSAGICVLAPNFKALQTVDNPTDKPYKELQETIWEWLWYLDHIILPHYKSDHPESKAIDKEVEFCKKNNISFKTLRDWEVIIIE